ncbi:MAG: hypothetical protein A2Y25_11830 [Candidatus Melainabacteria bacterium GWF2_37_15]|nr:MAG: hypothetical protein A2Y25_11830 [Candidatus Melainabacteria bacterium GWF2_37_15]
MIGIDKSGGLWYDEIVTYNIASNDSIVNVFNASLPRPFYFIILHYWMMLFGDTDITLRLLSVIFGVISVLVMYFAGRELDKSAGNVAALLVAVNSFLIYYSQEVRQYSFLALISTLSAWFTVRIINKPNTLNYLLFFIINGVFLATHYISVLIVIPEIIFLCVYLFLNNKEKFSGFLKTLAVFSIPCVFVLISLIQTFINGSVTSSWKVLSYSEIHYFDPQVIFVLLQNYFSPVVTGIYNNPPYYLSKVLSHLNLNVVVYIIIPIIIGIWFMIKAVISDKNRLNPVYALLLPPVCFLAIVLTLSYLQTYVIISRYTLICMPFFMLVAAKGITSFKYRVLSRSVFSFLIVVSLLYILFSPTSAPKIDRPDKQKVIAGLFETISLKKNDIVFFPRIKNKIDKYNKAEFRKYTLPQTFLKKDNISALIGKESAKNISMSNSSEILRKYLLMDGYLPEFEEYVKEKFFDTLQDSDYFIITHNKDICYYNSVTLKGIASNDALFKKNPLQFMLYSKITIDLLRVANKHLELKEVRKEAPWTVLIFQKKGK